MPRLTDLHALYASTAGKIELEYAGEERSESEIIERLLNRAVLAVFDQRFKLDDLAPIVAHFEAGWGVEVCDRMPAEDYLEGVQAIPGLREAVAPPRPVREPRLHRRGDRARPRGPAPAPEAQPRQRGGAVELPRVRTLALHVERWR